MANRQEAIGKFPQEVKLIEDLGYACIGYTLWPDNVVRFYFNVGPDTLALEQPECTQEKIIEKANKAIENRK